MRATVGAENALEIDALVDRFLVHASVEQGLSRNTIDAYARDLARFAEYLASAGVGRIRDVRREHLGGFVVSLEERRLHGQIAGSDFYRHAPFVNPELSDWKDALRRAKEHYGARLVKIIPTYQCYEVDGP